MTRIARLVLAGAIIAASCSVATAQTMRVSGTIERADGKVLSLKSSDGAEVKLTLTENAMIKPDGTLEANRINVGRDGVVPQ